MPPEPLLTSSADKALQSNPQTRGSVMPPESTGVCASGEMSSRMEAANHHTAAFVILSSAGVYQSLLSAHSKLINY